MERLSSYSGNSKSCPDSKAAHSVRVRRTVFTASVAVASEMHTGSVSQTSTVTERRPLPAHRIRILAAVPVQSDIECFDRSPISDHRSPPQPVPKDVTEGDAVMIFRSTGDKATVSPPLSRFIKPRQFSAAPRAHSPPPPAPPPHAYRGTAWWSGVGPPAADLSESRSRPSPPPSLLELATVASVAAQGAGATVATRSATAAGGPDGCGAAAGGCGGQETRPGQPRRRGAWRGGGGLGRSPSRFPCRFPRLWKGWKREMSTPGSHVAL